MLVDYACTPLPNCAPKLQSCFANAINREQSFRAGVFSLAVHWKTANI